ncbi:MAG: hypothetical protein Q8878_00875, partial [Bacillota bacterium]|nr:hypothetical protein [Bacillota bacterium]
EGVYMNSVLPSGANIQPPCYIGKNVVIRKGAVIGPYAVIDDGSVIDGGAVVERSVVDKAHIAPNSSLFGAIVSRAAVIREGTGLSEGSVIGEGTVIGEGAVVYEGVRVWPRKLVAPGSHVHYNIMTGSPQNGLSFEGPGILTGEINADMTPEILMGIGSYLGENKECGVGFAGGRAAEMLAGALIAGIEAAGGTAVVTDAKLASAMSFAARLYRFPASVFLKQKESYADIYIFDSNGLLMKKDQRRKMAAAVTRGEISRAAAPQSGGRRDITGLMRSYAATYALVDLGGFSCSVQDTAQNAPLAEALTMCGASVSPAKRKKLPSFELADDGMALCAYDEEGKYADAGHMYVLSAVCAVKNGKGESVTAYFDAPNILEAAVYSCGGKVNRVSRENAGQDTAIRDQTFLRDGVSAALNIALYLITSGESLKSALAAIPDFYTATREIDVSRNRASMMQALLQECAGVKRELCDGVKLCVDSGWVHISPLDRISRLKVTSEGMNSEIAGELCDMFSERLKKLDQRGGTIS